MSSAEEKLGIVVGVDYSDASKVAVIWAARDAALRNLPLTLVSVVDPIFEDWTWVRTPVEFQRWQTERAASLLDCARSLVEQDASQGRPAAVNTKILHSATIPTLIDLTKEAEMVVVGSRGRGTPARVLLGSVSTALVHHAHGPVAVIHDEDPLMAQPLQAPVLLGIDGSPASERATAIAFDEASRRGVGLVALHAWSDLGAGELPGMEWSALEAQADETLAERLAGWQERYPDVEITRVVVCDKPASQLIERSEAAQLVVVGSHGRGGFAGMLLGSVSSAVVHSARMPVIVARAD